MLIVPATVLSITHRSMKKKCSMPPAPFVPYWIVAQRENTDLDALSSSLKEDLIEIEE